MNRETIKKTAIATYEPKEDVYVVQSPLLDICRGVAEDANTAWEIFDDLLDEMYIVYLEGKKVGPYHHKQKVGRPAKGGVEIHAHIKESSKAVITNLAKQLGTSQGETIDYLTHFWKAQTANRESRDAQVQISERTTKLQRPTANVAARKKTTSVAAALTTKAKTPKQRTKVR